MLFLTGSGNCFENRGEDLDSFAEICMGQIEAMGREACPSSPPFHFRNADTIDQEKEFIVVCDLGHSEYVCREIIFQTSSAAAPLGSGKSFWQSQQTCPLAFGPKLVRVNSG